VPPAKLLAEPRFRVVRLTDKVPAPPTAALQLLLPFRQQPLPAFGIAAGPAQLQAMGLHHGPPSVAVGILACRSKPPRFVSASCHAPAAPARSASSPPKQTRFPEVGVDGQRSF